MSKLPQNETRERIFDTAEELFMARGYSSVKLRDIADAVGMRHASLYYYVPNGKEQLFIEVIRRAFKRHNHEMTKAIESADGDLRAQIHGVSDWFASQPPIDLVRMFEADLPTLNDDAAKGLDAMAFEALTTPLVRALRQAADNGVIALGQADINMAAMSLLTLIQGVHHVPMIESVAARQSLARRVCNLLLNGLLKR